MCDPSAWVKETWRCSWSTARRIFGRGPYPSAAPPTRLTTTRSRVGSLNSATRTPLQTHLAAFWQSNPAPNYNLLAQRFVAENSLDTTDSARLFAMIDLTAADAIITAWSDKYARLFWRPMAAIRHGGGRWQFRDDGQSSVDTGSTRHSRDCRRSRSGADHAAYPGTRRVPPPMPARRCTRSSRSSAQTTRHYVTSSRFPGEQLSLNHFSALVDQSSTRNWAGIHFRNADVQAANIGGKIEAWTTRTVPVRPLTVQRSDHGPLPRTARPRPAARFSVVRPTPVAMTAMATANLAERITPPIPWGSTPSVPLGCVTAFSDVRVLIGHPATGRAGCGESVELLRPPGASDPPHRIVSDPATFAIARKGLSARSAAYDPCTARIGG